MNNEHYNPYSYYNQFFDIDYFIELLMSGYSIKEIARDWEYSESILKQCAKELNL